MRRILILALALVALAQPLYAAALGGSEPLKVKSDNLTADNDKKTATFEGNVVARQGELILYADRLVVSYAGSGSDLSQVEAFGNVRILQGNRQATGGHAVYDPKAAKIVLDGNPRVAVGDDVITGKVITYFVDEQKSVVTGGPKERVEAVIHPGGKNAGAKR